MRYREQCYTQLLSTVIKLGLHIHAHRRSAFVQNSKQRFMVEQTSHSNSLLLSSRQHIVPVINSIETFFSLLDVVKLYPAQKPADLLITPSDSFFGMRVDNLISESTRGKVRALRNIKELVHVRSVQNPTSERP